MFYTFSMGHPDFQTVINFAAELKTQIANFTNATGKLAGATDINKAKGELKSMQDFLNRIKGTTMLVRNKGSNIAMHMQKTEEVISNAIRQAMNAHELAEIQKYMLTIKSNTTFLASQAQNMYAQNIWAKANSTTVPLGRFLPVGHIGPGIQ